MFADNWKISVRQVRRLLILDIFGMSSLMLPGILSSLTGADGVFCLLLGMAGGMLLVWLMGKNLRNMEGETSRPEGCGQAGEQASQHIGRDYYQYMKDTVGELAGDIFMVFYYLYFLSLCGFVLYQATALVLTWLLPEGSYFWVSLLLLALAAYGTVRGIEGRARVYEIIFWFLGVPLLAMLLLALREVRPDYWTPVMYSGGWEFFSGGIGYLVFLLPLTAVLFLKPFCQNPGKLASCARWVLLGVTALNLLIYLILLGVFGQNTMGVLKRPVVTLMSMINIPGGFFTRQDVIMVSVWFFALFALMHTGVFQSTLILKELFHESGNRISMGISLVLAFASGIGFFRNRFLAELYGIYQKWVALPGMAVILLALLLVHRMKHRQGRKMEKGHDPKITPSGRGIRKKKALTLFFAVGAMGNFAGCASTELEHRSFPLAVGIDLQGEPEEDTAEEGFGENASQGQGGQKPGLVVSFDFPDLAQVSEKGNTVDTAMGLSLEGADMYHVEKAYENNTNRILDYNHMKAVVIGEPVFSDKERLRALLSAWEQREASARNTSLLVGKGSAAGILSLTEETEGSMGTYLEEMLESQKDFKQNKIATVGNLMNQWHNQDELLLIPVLEENGNRPVVGGYAAVSDFNYRGTLSVEDAMLAYLSQNLLEKFTCEISGNVVEISGIQVSLSIRREGELPLAEVKISGKGKLKTGQMNSYSEQRRLEKKLGEQLTADLAEAAGRLQEELGIDMTNSFISLGGQDRELYGIYQGQPDAYNGKVQQVFQVEVSMLNWE